MTDKLLTREEFRSGVFERDLHRCVICGHMGGIAEKLDAHHIIERRLFANGGYYLDNGATLCDNDGQGCHMKAETTELSCEAIRDAAGIKTVILPPHLYRDQRYDKWGNPIQANGTRLRGELYEDASVQKVLSGVSYLFTKYVKYPRTYHFPWSPGIGKDDRVMESNNLLVGCEDIVVTEKMDGENTTLYNDYMHARSLDYSSHESRHRVKALWASLSGEIPDDYRICCENVYAKHSIGYDDLPGYLLMYSLWDNTHNMCEDWDKTTEWAALLGLPLVRVLYRGPWNEALIKGLAIHTVAAGGEGIVARVAGSFHYANFRKCVAKYVRKGHVQTHGHWMRNMVTPNKLKDPADD